MVTANSGHITKQIFVIGGVVSSLGKGITSSSLGRLLRSRGVKVLQQKLDPYMNVDPGTMNPFQHGEVYVTEDGAETDLDLGHYERFLGTPLSQKASVSSGQIYQEVLRKERAGEYLGECVQVIPHVTDEIKRRMRSQAGDDVDVIITEIGGTIGDIESLAFMEAARQVCQEIGQENCMFITVSLVPYLRAPKEFKTKPTQQAVMLLRREGISPDAIVLRSELPLPNSIKEKVALMCGIKEKGVISCPDAENIYMVPKMLHEEGLDSFVVERLGLKAHELEWGEWADLMDAISHLKGSVEIAIVGKYVDLPDAYLSVVESVKAAGFGDRVDAKIRWIDADECTDDEKIASLLKGCDGLIIPGGFGKRAVEGMIRTLRWARENNFPALGICLGLQCMVIEYARDVLGLKDASSTEFNPNTSNPVIATMEEQKAVIAGTKDMGHTMRLGSYPAVLKEGTKAYSLYGKKDIAERHRHRYEVNSAYKKALEDAGLTIAGTSPDGELVEFVEVTGNLFYVATQAHPEMKSRPYAPHPLFKGLVDAAIVHKKVREDK